MRFINSKIVVIALIIIYTVLVLINLPGNILSWDTFGAYLYLPATFIYHDPALMDLSWVHQINETYHSTETLYQLYPTETGGNLIKYPMGFSVLFSPFFFLGHFFAWLLPYPMDGFSKPYQYAILFGNWTYIVIGLVYLRKLLLHFFNEKIVVLLILLLFFGTNYYFTIIYMPGMPHGYLFTFYVLILLATIKWHENPSIKNSIILGLLMGLATLARASEILVVTIPLFWNTFSIQSLKNKIQFLKKHQKALLITISTFIFMGLPQLVYFKIVSGHFFVDSYNNPGEGFDFLHPHTINFLFSFRKGWFVYTPILLFSVVGLVLNVKAKKNYSYSFLIFFILNVYLLSSWTCWWYAESFGQRPVIESYPIMIISLGTFLQVISEKKKLRNIIVVLFGFFIYLNLFQTWQINHGLLHPSRTTRASYFVNFLKTEPSPEYNKLLLLDQSIPAKERVVNHHVLNTFTENFESIQPDKQNQLSNDAYEGHFSSIVDSLSIYSLTLEKEYRSLLVSNPDSCVLRISAFVKPIDSSSNIQKISLVSKFLHKRKPYGTYSIDFEKSFPLLKSNQWNEVSFYRYFPTIRNFHDEIQVFLYNRGKSTALVDLIKIEIVAVDKR